MIALVERGGKVRSFHVPSAHADTVAKIVRDNIAHESRLHTDESKLYIVVGREFAAHETVNHARAKNMLAVTSLRTQLKAISRSSSAECAASTSTAARSTLHRYLAEFDFRYNYRASLGFNDKDRTVAAVRAGEGKRLTYHQPR